MRRVPARSRRRESCGTGPPRRRTILRSVADAGADDQLLIDSSAWQPGTGPAGTGAVPVGTGTRPGRTWSLKTEWSRAFALMLMALLVGALATIVGVRAVRTRSRKRPPSSQRASDTVAELRSALDAHEQAGHRLLSGAPADRPAFLQQQQDLARRFDDAIGSCCRPNGTCAPPRARPATSGRTALRNTACGTARCSPSRETAWPSLPASPRPARASVHCWTGSSGQP